MRLQSLHSKEKASYPAALHLMAYGFAIALPLVLMLSALLWQTAAYEQAQSRQRILRVLEALTDNIDRDLDRHLTILQTLATSLALQQQDWPTFYQQAKSALQGRAYAVLVDASGRQLVNTYVPYGEEPPMTGDPETLRRMAETKRPVFSDLFTSLVVQDPVVNVSIPILRNNELRYVLSLGLLPADLAALLEDQALDPNWVSLIWDSHNVILARSRANDEYVGRTLPMRMRAQSGPIEVIKTSDLDGADVLYAASRSRISGWGVGVNVPVGVLSRQMHITAWLATAALAAIVLAVGLGIVFARRLTRPLAAASAAAVALGRGEPIAVAHSRLKEADLFLRALQTAADELAARTSEVRASETRLAATLEQMPCGVGLMDRSGQWIIANPIMRQFVPDQAPWRNQDRMQRWQAFDAKGLALESSEWPSVRALRGEIVSPGTEFLYTNDQGEQLWIRIAAAPFRDAGGELAGAIAIAQDITEQKRLVANEKLLIGELQHRTSNLLAVVQAIAQKSLSEAATLVEAKAKFESRLQALARVHGELTRSNWTGVSLKEIVLSTLAPYSARINIAGCPVKLAPKEAQNFSLALHELATNALKYGALSAPEGSVDIGWSLAGEGQDCVLRFQWLERGGPAVVTPERHGFGSSLLRATFSDIKIDYTPAGLTCEIQVPLGKTDVEAA